MNGSFFMVNVGKYTIHGWYGIWKEIVPESKGVIIYDTNPNNAHFFWTNPELRCFQTFFLIFPKMGSLLTPCSTWDEYQVGIKSLADKEVSCHPPMYLA